MEYDDHSQWPGPIVNNATRCGEDKRRRSRSVLRHRLSSALTHADGVDARQQRQCRLNSRGRKDDIALLTDVVAFAA